MFATLLKTQLAIKDKCKLGLNLHFLFLILIVIFDLTYGLYVDA